MKLSRMAWRNVWRNQRRTWVTVIAMALGLLAMIAYAGLMRGYLLHMEQQILEVEMGEAQVHATGYRDDPSLYTRVMNSAAIVESLEKAGFRASPRLLGAGLAAAADNSSGAMLIGVDVARDKRASVVNTKVTAGTWLEPTKPKGVVIGHWLAKTLELKPGGEIVVLSQAADGSTANDVYTISGILGSMGQGIDRSGIFMTEAAFRELMVVPVGAHRIIVRSPEGMTLDDATAAAKTRAPGHEVKNWQELMPIFAQMFQSVQGAMAMMSMIIFVAVGIVLLNTMLMAVFERVREIGILKALGFSPGAVLGLVLLESAIQTALAIGIGVALSLPLTWYLRVHGIAMGGGSIEGLATPRIWRALPDASSWLQPISILLFVVFVAVLYPALKAAFIRPVEAIRHR